MSTKQRVAVGGDGDWSTEASGFLEDDLALLIDSYQTPWWRAVATGGRRRATGWPLPTAVLLVSPPRSPSPAPPTSRPWRRRRNRMDQNCCSNFGPRGLDWIPCEFGASDATRTNERIGGDPANMQEVSQLIWWWRKDWGKLKRCWSRGKTCFTSASLELNFFGRILVFGKWK